jgi:hypothetical protein
MRRRHTTGTARDTVIGPQAPFGEDGEHDSLCPLDRSLRDGRPLFSSRGVVSFRLHDQDEILGLSLRDATGNTRRYRS